MRYSPDVKKTSGEHTEQESNSKAAGERQGEEREERRGTRGRGAHLAWGGAKGQAPGGRRDRTRAQGGNETRTHVQCCRVCVQGGGYHEAGSTARKGKKNTHKHSRRANSTEREGSGRAGRSKRGRRGDTGGRKKNSDTGEQAGKRHGCRGAGPGGRAPNTSRKKHTTHTKGGGKRDPC